jgi:hypothetical protein
MTINDYIGIPYDPLSKHGFNCWSFVASVYLNLLSSNLVEFNLTDGSQREIASVFASALASGDHEFKQIDKKELRDYDLVLFARNKLYHVGLWLNGKVIHCSSRANGVAIQTLDAAKDGFKEVTFWRK